jgi:hypothetical protein
MMGGPYGMNEDLVVRMLQLFAFSQLSPFTEPPDFAWRWRCNRLSQEEVNILMAEP